MKRIICAFLCLIVLCSCSKETAEIKVVNKGIAYTAHINYCGKEYDCEVNISKDGTAKYLVTSPKNLKDFTIVFENEKIKSFYKGLEYTPDISALPQGSLLTELYAVNCFFNLNNYTVYKTKDGFFADGKTKNGEFKLFITQGGLPLSLEFDDKDFEVEFSGVSLLN